MKQKENRTPIHIPDDPSWMAALNTKAKGKTLLANSLTLAKKQALIVDLDPITNVSDLDVFTTNS